MADLIFRVTWLDLEILLTACNSEPLIKSMKFENYLRRVLLRKIKCKLVDVSHIEYL